MAIGPEREEEEEEEEAEAEGAEEEETTQGELLGLSKLKAILKNNS